MFFNILNPVWWWRAVRIRAAARRLRKEKEQAVRALEGRSQQAIETLRRQNAEALAAMHEKHRQETETLVTAYQEATNKSAGLS